MKFSIDLSRNINTLKWLGLILMTLDHVNKYMYAESIQIFFEAGRLVMPLFAFILAYNLNRQEKDDYINRHYRVIKRLFVFGIIATPAYFFGDINQKPMALNILFLLLGCTILDLILHDKKNLSRLKFLAWFSITFFVTSCFCEYWFIGILVFLASRYFVLKMDLLSLIYWVLAVSGLVFINQNQAALWVIPLILLSSLKTLSTWLENQAKSRKYRLFFYAYYPTHLSIIVLLANIKLL